MSSACARTVNGIRAGHSMRRLSTTCTEFSFQIVHFLDRLPSLHQRAFRPNVHATRGFSARCPMYVRSIVPPKFPIAPLAGKEASSHVPRRSLIPSSRTVALSGGLGTHSFVRLAIHDRRRRLPALAL